MAKLQTRLGHEFSDTDLLAEALTHASYAGKARDNQRLEFLGDRVLGLVMAEALLNVDQGAKEGVLAPRLNAMVRKEMCYEIATEIGLGDAMRLGKSETLSGGRRKLAILGDAMEAVIAAVYLDAGFETAGQMILRLWGDRIRLAERAARDPKTALQEWAQAKGWPPPVYVEISRKGPDHAPTFVIEARLENGEVQQASARSIRAAQQEAATLLLARLEAA